MKTILVTGGYGFIGSHFIKIFSNRFSDFNIFCLDSLTYAADLDNLKGYEDNFTFLHGDISDPTFIKNAFKQIGDIDYLINFAAESHVDRSIFDPDAFISTNISGVHVLCNQARKGNVGRVIQISSDEIYGPVLFGQTDEKTPMAPTSPYASSKAAGELIAMSYYKTYGVPLVITRGSNTYGTHQYPEKIIPCFLTRLLENKPLPLNTPSSHSRDWLHVSDHVEGIITAMFEGTSGSIYNIGADNVLTNKEIAKIICKLSPNVTIQEVNGRPIDDARYCVDATKLKSLGWGVKMDLLEEISNIYNWYKENRDWWISKN